MRPGSYEEWVRRYDTITRVERDALRAEAAWFPRPPLISILLPIFNPQLDWLGEAIASVRAQTYPRWQLCMADDASTNPHVRPYLKQQAASDKRIKLVFRGKNGHISACSNSALALATGDWCGLLDQDDVLREHALSLVVREIHACPEAGLIYSDEDFIDVHGVRSNPFIKPDWNPELFLGQNYVNHFGVYRTDLLREIGGFRVGYEGSQDYDLVLRCIERLHRGQIRHIPRVLYHWRMVPGSLAEVRDAKPYAKEAARRALAEHVHRCEIRARVAPCPESVESHRVTFEVPEPPPLVSVIVDGPGSPTAAYPAFEIIAADQSITSSAARINAAAASAKGSILVLLGKGVEISEEDWLDEFVGQAARPEIGAVGARVWNADDTLRHGGYLLGVGGVASSAHEGLPRGHPGFFNRTFLQRNCSAVSAECMAVRASVFQQLGGFDSVNLAERFHDIDFCLRAAEQGLQIVWTPYVNPVSHAAPGRTLEADEQYMRSRWSKELAYDPFYSPSLTLEPPAFELAFPPRWLSDASPSPPASVAPQPRERGIPAPRGTPQSFADRLRRWWRGARTD